MNLFSDNPYFDKCSECGCLRIAHNVEYRLGFKKKEWCGGCILDGVPPDRECSGWKN